MASNTATGYQALLKNTTGTANTGFGYQVLANNTTGSNNTAVGYQTLTLNTGVANSAMGYQALGKNTTGGNNTAVGWQALYENVTGSNNSALGYDAGPDTGYGALTNTTAIGYGAKVTESNTIRLGNANITNLYTSGRLNSTQGIYVGPDVLNSNAILEGNSSTKGLLLPRLALTSATAATPLTVHVAGMMIYNTATAGTAPNNVTPGQYYNNGSKWVKVGEYTTEPWYVAGIADTEATLNTQNIYQMGSVGIGKQNSSNIIKLDVSSDANINGITVGKGTGNTSAVTAYNTAIGYQALLKNTTGIYNTASGYQSLAANTTASGNTAFGYRPLAVNTTGGSNTSIGGYSLVANTTGSINTALGYYALSRNTTGSYNTAVGQQALYENTTGTYNTALGYYSGSSTSSRTLTNTTAIGYNAAVTVSNTIRLGDTNITDLYTDGRLNSTRGVYAGPTTMNTNAMLEVSSTTKGLLLPRVALTSTTSFAPLTAHVAGMVVYNTATAGVDPNDVSPGQYYNNGTRWVRVAEFKTEPWYVAGGTTQATLNTQNIYQMGSVGIGKENNNTAIKLDIASDVLINGITVGRGGGNIETNTVLGSGAFAKNTTGTGNVAIGLSALPANTIGSDNVAVGAESLSVNTSGSNNVVLGRFAAQRNTTGSENVAVGYDILQSNTTGSQNTALGGTALNTNSTGTQNTAVGYGAGPSGSNFQNTTAVGYAASATQSNMVRIGNAAVTRIMGQVGFSTSSDIRYKKDIETIPLGLAFINKLRPVSYVRKNNEEQTKEWGIIAQELQQVLDDIGYQRAGIVQEDHTPDHYLSVRYTDFIAPLIKGIQELSEENDSISKNIDKSEVEIEQLRKEVAELKQKVKQAVDKK